VYRAITTEFNHPSHEGDVYLIHFDEPFGHARHYLGFAKTGKLDRRIAQHRRGKGANLLTKVKEAGIGWNVVRTWPGGGRKMERVLKNRGSSARHCPVCLAKPNSDDLTPMAQAA